MAALLLAALPGCQKDNALTASLDRSYHDPIQRVVDDKIAQQSAGATGAQRWEQYKANEYQTPAQAPRDPYSQEMETSRRQQADRLLAPGKISLADCLASCLALNDRIQASRAVVRSTGGDKLIAQSRFLPHLAYDLSRRSAAENVGHNVAMSVAAFQTLLEFGKDNPIDVALRDIERQALFDYEQAAAAALSEVRLRYFTILLRQQQLAERGKLRAEFQAGYERVRKLEESRRMLQVDVMTSRLNVLNEDTRINALEKEILRLKMDLLYSVGLPVQMTSFELDGEPEQFTTPIDDATEIAYRRSTRIAQARATVFEQDRVVRQVIWEYFPHVDMVGGYRGRYVSAGGQLVDVDRTYGAGPLADYHVKPWNGTQFATDPSWLDLDASKGFWAFQVELPIFTGLERTGRFQREKALLDQDRHLLSDTVWTTDLDVRKAYQTVLEREKETEILQETVRISKERLRVKERLKEMGMITDNELETFRDRFFADQDKYFEQQIRLVEAQERLRLAMRYFEPAPEEGN